MLLLYSGGQFCSCETKLYILISVALFKKTMPDVECNSEDEEGGGGPSVGRPSVRPSVRPSGT